VTEVVRPPLAADIAADRARVAAELAAAAARKRFEIRRKRFNAGFSDRRRNRAARAVSLAAFLAFVAAPTLAVGIGVGWIAADRYVVEARFVLTPNLSGLGEGRLGGAPSLQLVRDTQVVAQFLRSRAMATALESDIGLRARIESPGLDPGRPFDRVSPDPIWGLARDATADDLAEHWEAMTRTRISRTSGVVTFSVEAFSPQDAVDLAEGALAGAEALVNSMNARVWRDTVERAETLFAEAARRLARAETALAGARDAAGVLDVTSAAAALTGVASAARADLVALRQERAARAGQLSPGSAALRALDRRIASVREQIAGIEASLASRPGEEGGATLSGAMESLSAHEVERAVAQRQFLAASEQLEASRAASEAQMLYLQVFVLPAAPEEAALPRRGWWIAGTLGIGLALWGVAVGGFSLVRNHLA